MHLNMHNPHILVSSIACSHQSVLPQQNKLDNGANLAMVFLRPFSVIAYMDLHGCCCSRYCIWRRGQIFLNSSERIVFCENKEKNF